jgi:uncharacterized iron-regulated membrane protein
MNTPSPAFLYRTLWRWHFYAGIFCIPFVLTLAVSGAIYLFKPQVDAWQESPYRNLSVSGPRAPAAEHIQAAMDFLPGGQFVHYRLPQSPTDAVAVTLTHQGTTQKVFVHPHTLEILHAQDTQTELMQLVKRFHGELLAGDAGSILVELAGCWAIVLVLTGLYLWWPRNAQGLAGVLYPRLRGGKRLFWRDLHAATGFWVAGFTLFLLISGLPWALVWGGALKELRQRDNPHEHHQMAQADWSLHSFENPHAQHSTWKVYLSETVVQNAQTLNFAPPAELSPTADNSGNWVLKSQTQNRPQRAEAWLDGDTGEVLRTATFAEKKLLDRVIGTGIAAHEGQLFGWFNQLLGLFTTFSLILMSISGFILWRRRKPAGILGAPPPLPQSNAGRVVAGVILALSLVLPLLAISLVVILLSEWLVLRRMEAARRWLGLSA